MAHESFEDETAAELLNKDFISIKVDREERPDIDSVYMAVCQAFTGSGGWPTSIFMTPDKKPFYAGTYFPIQSKYGMPGFKELLQAISEQWKNNRTKMIQSADEIVNHITKENMKTHKDIDRNITEKAVKLFSRSFDAQYGGFGAAPKFPTPHNLIFLTMYCVLMNDKSSFEMVETTLMQMRKGGIFDHIGYGFSRYSTDKYYLAPHFEKMLYDNALLMIAYISAYSVSKNEIYLSTCHMTAKYIIREMTSSEGGFYSAQDADSEGVEGKFYVFGYDEIISILGKKKGKEFASTYDITMAGNFEGTNIPNLLKSNHINNKFEHELSILYDYRLGRTKLHIDDKILTSWNSLMIMAFAMLYRITRKDIYLDTAKKAQEFIEEKLCSSSTLYVSYRNKKRSEKGFIDDYAFYTAALIELYNSTLNKSYLDKAELFCSEAVDRFADAERGGFFLSDANNNELFMNPKETYDGAMPSGNSVMAYNLVRLFQLTEKEEYNKLLKKQIDFMLSQAQDYPAGNSMFMLAMLIYENPPKHIAVALAEQTDIFEIQNQLPFFTNIIIVDSENKEYPIINNQTTYYVCKDYNCLPPTNNIELIRNDEMNPLPVASS